MYGEQDQTTLSMRKKMKSGVQYRLFGKASAVNNYMYAGNTATMFAELYKALQQNAEIGGQYFFATDDTPLLTAIEMRQVWIPGEDAVVIPSSWYIPEIITIMLFTFIYYVLLLIRQFVKLNVPVSSKILCFSMNKSFLVSRNKAETVLGYKPLYDFESAKKRTKSYFASLS